MSRHFLLAAAAAAVLSSNAAAQTTLVTGTVKDLTGLAYAGVTGQPTVLVNNAAQCAAAVQGSAPCQIVFQGTNGPITLDKTGSFSLALQDNALVTPAGTQWLFSVTTNGAPLPLGTGSQSCSATLTITGATQSISASFAACPVLSAVVGGSVPAGSNTQIQFNDNGSFGADQAFTYNKTTRSLSVFDPSFNMTGAVQSFASGPTSANFVTITDTPISFFNASLLLGARETGDSVVVEADQNINLFAQNGKIKVGAQTGAGVSGNFSFVGKTSGAADLGVVDVAGSPARINLPTATAPAAGAVLASDAGTPQQTSWNILYKSCGTTTACANTALSGARTIFGTVPLTSGTPSTATVTGISPAFTSSSSFVCTVTEQTTATNNLLKVANVSSSSFTITGPNTITDVINYVCVGN